MNKHSDIFEEEIKQNSEKGERLPPTTEELNKLAKQSSRSRASELYFSQEGIDLENPYNVRGKY